MFLALPIFLDDAYPSYFLSKAFCLNLSSKFNSVIVKFEGCKANNFFVPSFLVISTPLTKILVFLNTIFSTLPSCFLKPPCIILTLSPFLNPMLLLLYFFLSSFERCACTNLCLIWSGVLNLYFLCFLGFLLLFHVFEKLLILTTQTTTLAIFAMLGHLSHASFAIAPLNIVPFGFPLSSFKTTAALSSNFILMPSALRYSFFCLTMTA